MRHEVIYALYPQCTNITDNVGAFDIDNNKIDIDETLIQAKICLLYTSPSPRDS